MRKQRRWTEKDIDKEIASLENDPILFPNRGTKSHSKGRYGNVQKITEDGIRFDSKREYLRYKELKLLERAGEIRDLKVHPKYPITIGGVEVMVSSNQHNKWDRHLTYEADFQYRTWNEDGDDIAIIEDVKMQSGHRTGVYKLKRALMRAMGYDIEEY